LAHATVFAHEAAGKTKIDEARSIAAKNFFATVFSFELLHPQIGDNRKMAGGQRKIVMPFICDGLLSLLG
jgi:hypothetical protein